MESLDARHIVIEGKNFYLKKMGPMEAERLFISHVRPLLGGLLEAEVGDGEGLAIWKLAVALVTKAPEEHYWPLRAKLLENVLFEPPHAAGTGPPQQLPVSSNPHTALDGLDMVHTLELVVRSFIVNFFGSWDALKSRFPQAQTLEDGLISSTPTPSSQTPSRPSSVDGQTIAPERPMETQHLT